MPPYKFLSAVYTWCVERIDPTKREEWDMMLTEPLPWQQKVVTDTQREIEGADFMATMAMHQMNVGG